jgi:hypothetical protein
MCCSVSTYSWKCFLVYPTRNWAGSLCPPLLGTRAVPSWISQQKMLGRAMRTLQTCMERPILCSQTIYMISSNRVQRRERVLQATTYTYGVGCMRAWRLHEGGVAAGSARRRGSPQSSCTSMCADKCNKKTACKNYDIQSNSSLSIQLSDMASMQAGATASSCHS